MAEAEHPNQAIALSLQVLMAEIERKQAEVSLIREAIEILRRKISPSPTPSASTRPRRGDGRSDGSPGTPPRTRIARAGTGGGVRNDADGTAAGGLTSEQLAEAMGVNQGTISVWRKSGMPHAKVGTLFMHDLAACRAWREQNPDRRRAADPARHTSPRKASRRSTAAPAIDGGTASSAAPDADVDADEPAPEAAGTIGGALAADGGLFVPGPSEKAHHTEPPADQAQRRVLRMFARVNRALLMTEARDELQIAAIPTIEIRALLACGFLEPGTLNGRPAYRITTAGRLAADKSRSPNFIEKGKP